MVLENHRMQRAIRWPWGTRRRWMRSGTHSVGAIGAAGLSGVQAERGVLGSKLNPLIPFTGVLRFVDLVCAVCEDSTKRS